MSDAQTPAQPRLKGMLICVALAVVLSIAGWLRLRVDSSLEPLLPENSQARQTILFFRDSSFANKAILWFRLTGEGTAADLYAAADAVEKRVDPHLISRVIHAPNESSALDEAVGLLDRAGELLSESDLKDLEKATTPDALHKKMREDYVQLVKPEGTFFLQIMQHDPLGISSRILSRLYALTNGLGYRIELKDGHFLNPDGRQLMMVLETSSSATNLASSESLVHHLNDLAASAPPGIQIIPICGQIHTEENSRLMQRDIHMAGAISSITFILLFLCISRDWRVAAVFLLPVAATGITIGLVALFYPDLSAMMLGMTVAMAGSAVDYGIFVYTAVWMGTDPGADLRRIRRPLIISHLTTLGVFFAFLFSKIPAYRQLGVLVSVSLILSLLAALFILPRLLKPGGKIVALGRGMPLARWGKAMIPATIIGSVLLIVGIVIASHIRFDPDITRLDGVEDSVKQHEKDFQKNWGRTDTELAMLVVTGKTADDADKANDEMNQLISPHFPDGKFVSLASFWPSAEIRQQNLARWNQFWSPQQIAKLRTDLAAAGEPFGFTADAFDPFFQQLSHPQSIGPIPGIVAKIRDQFTARSVNGDWQVLSYFEDTPENGAAVTKLIAAHPEAQIVSRGGLSHAFEESAVAETHLLVGISFVFIVGSLLLMTRSLAKSLVIMLPVFAGIIAMLAVLQILSLSMSVVTVVAAIIVLALTSDYGVFAAYAWDNHETILGQGMASVHLSFLTTLVGVGVMIFARHPALFLVGVSLTSGLLAGYITAFFVIPGVCFLRDKITKPAAVT